MSSYSEIIVGAVNKVGPTVVSISTVRIAQDTYFRAAPVQGMGSGVIIDEGGTILTNHHIIERSRRVAVTLPTGQKLDGTIIGTDRVSDVAVIRVKADGLSQAELGNSDALKVGHWSHEIDDDRLGISVQFGRDDSGLCFELVAPNGQPNPVDGTLARKANQLNHVAYRVVDFEASTARLRALGAMPLGAVMRAKACDGSRIIFLRTRIGVIVELIEGLSDDGPGPAGRG